jgi:imidazoleglycerol phosphate synthase glutamine amidotransferase subunit HisH
MKYLLIIPILIITACADLNLYREVVTEATKTAKDAEARTLADSICLMGIGAMARTMNSIEQRRILEMCGVVSTCESEMTIEQLRKILELTRPEIQIEE